MMKRYKFINPWRFLARNVSAWNIEDNTFTGTMLDLLFVFLSTKIDLEGATKRQVYFRTIYRKTTKPLEKDKISDEIQHTSSKRKTFSTLLKLCYTTKVFNYDTVSAMKSGGYLRYFTRDIMFCERKANSKFVLLIEEYDAVMRRK